MIKNLLIVLTITLCFLSISEAQVKPAQAQYLEQIGAFVNPGFEQGYKGWTTTQTCTRTRLTTVPLRGNNLRFACTAQNFTLTQTISTLNPYVGLGYVATCRVKATNIGDITIKTLANGIQDKLTSNETANAWELIKIRGSIDATNNAIEIAGTGITSTVDIDDCSIKLDESVLAKGNDGEFLMRDTTKPEGYDWFNGINITDFDDVPVGTIMAHGSTSVPNGYLLADGACIDKVENAVLFEVIGTSNGECTLLAANDGFNVPDLRGKFIRGHDGGAGNDPNRLTRTACSAGGATGDNPGTCQDDATAVNGITADQAAHDHRPTTNGINQAIGFSAIASSLLTTGYGAVGVDNAPSTSATDPAITVSSTNAETRPLNVNVVYIIKAIGRDPVSTVSQKDIAPNKAGFITFSAFSGDIKGHLPADGACVLEADYPDYLANVGNAYGDCTITVASDGMRLPDLETDNRFIRAAGGALAVGTTQTDTTAVNGLGLVDPGHSHNFEGPVSTQVVGVNFQNIYTNGGIKQILGTLSSVTGMSLTSSQTETRPNNMALKAYVRMVDNDTITGVFEQIKSSNLIQVTGRGNAGQTLTASQAIPFVEVKDTHSLWDGDTFGPVPRSGRFRFSGSTLWTTAAVRYGTARITGASTRFVVCTSNTTSDDKVKFDCAYDLLAGDSVEFIQPVAGGSLLNNVEFHNITISEEPDLSAIVENLHSNVTKCQTKILSATTNTIGTVAELTFNNLTVGKKYKAKAQMLVDRTAMTRFIHNGLSLSASNTTASGGQDTRPMATKVFTATTTTLDFRLDTANNLYANGLLDRTWTEICELPDSVIETTQF